MTVLYKLPRAKATVFIHETNILEDIIHARLSAAEEARKAGRAHAGG